MSAVVCAGIKSVLDIPRTLEFLETQGVTVASFGAGQPTFKLPCSWAPVLICLRLLQLLLLALELSISDCACLYVCLFLLVQVGRTLAK